MSTLKNTKQKVNGNLETYKNEVAEELGVNLGGKSSAKQNGSVGGEMTKKSVARGKQNTNTENLKYEVAEELGVNLGPDATAEENGRVGGEMTKKLVERGNGKKSNSKSSK